VCDQLRHAGATLIPSSIANCAWRITGAGTVLSELAAAGKVYLQDEASQLVARALGAQPGERILDLCAAPGSKTSQIADSTGDSASIVAADLHLHRLRTVHQTAQLHGLESICCTVLDGLKSLPLKDNSFDRVLVDAPCSGTGTLRRNPEIRWRISPADIEDLAQRQNQLLLRASYAVKPGGRLIYSTCSVEADENEDVAQSFLENSKDFHSAELPFNSSLVTASGGARTWPHRDGTDGFFIHAFKRKSD